MWHSGVGVPFLLPPSRTTLCGFRYTRPLTLRRQPLNHRCMTVLAPARPATWKGQDGSQQRRLGQNNSGRFIGAGSWRLYRLTSGLRHTGQTYILHREVLRQTVAGTLAAEARLLDAAE